MVKNILEIGYPYYINDEIVGVVISIDSYIDGCKKNLNLRKLLDGVIL